MQLHLARADIDIGDEFQRDVDGAAFHLGMREEADALFVAVGLVAPLDSERFRHEPGLVGYERRAQHRAELLRLARIGRQMREIVDAEIEHRAADRRIRVEVDHRGEVDGVGEMLEIEVEIALEHRFVGAALAQAGPLGHDPGAVLVVAHVLLARVPCLGGLAKGVEQRHLQPLGLVRGGAATRLSLSAHGDPPEARPDKPTGSGDRRP